ncbi:uncharacterized protein F4807DRAFT_458844 [Annulohypoxylon truncatum]|uniref:uncharacterized protein n=1 Tax=Annulohypoxylon truncatum TaxID=327061 RepID=UPI0020074159|nr:uncharacterized protein F4807DRAFT_458844 [Annulohypoxylon truncatum]KAI1211275.1 hypothetical protein F4807DRAFT_458844 [Annulohypoxylon truncatum]
MQFTATTTLALMTGLAAAYDPNPFVEPLQPWKITRFTIALPPSSAGTNGYATIKLAIENPNQVSAGPAPFADGGGYFPFPPSAANCTMTGHDTADAVTSGARCTETTQDTYGQFEVQVVDNGDNDNGAGVLDPNNLQLQFGLTYNVTQWNAHWYKTYDGTARFALNDNLVLGQCADHNKFCSYELDPNKAPLLVTPTMTDCAGTCSNDP